MPVPPTSMPISGPFLWIFSSFLVNALPFMAGGVGLSQHERLQATFRNA
jgi:hypothetical protein